MVEQALPAPRGQMMLRGVTKRCARCGGGKLFTGWFKMKHDCPRCGLHFEREPGYWTGAIAMNTMIILGLFLAVMLAFVAMSAPDIPWATLLMLEVPLMLIGPAFLYPYTKTIWVAVDRAFLMHL